MSSSTEKQSKGSKQKGIHAGFKKAWRAIKSAFSSSGKSKVVSIPSSSHSEPSDVEEDLFIQTQLRVFKPVCDQDVGDVLPGSYNGDQTLVEYTADPQPSSSGLHSAAPDHQPEKQSIGNKKKGKRASFKRPWQAIKGAFTRSGRIKVVPVSSPSHSYPCDLKEDLQPGPSGLQSAAQEELADKQPGSSQEEKKQQTQSTTKIKKKGIRVPFKRTWRAIKGTYSRSELGVFITVGLRHVGSFSMLYELGPVLGSGCFGSVHMGIRRSDGQEVAIKCIKKRAGSLKLHIPGHINPVFREVAVNLQLHKPEKCPYIVQMFDWFEEIDRHILILEYPSPCITMYDFVSDHQSGLDETLARHFMRQAAIAAKHWIDHGVTHGDMHMRNVLVNRKTLQIKFIDFGSGRLITARDPPGFGYCDHENAVKSTVGGLGRLLSIMVCGVHNVSVKLSEECTDLIKWTTYESARRQTLDEFMDHKWFKQE